MHIHCKAFNPILFKVIVRLIRRVQILQVLERRHSSRIVGGEGWSLQSLTQDLVAQTEVLGVESGVEDAALDLRGACQPAQDTRITKMHAFIRSNTRDFGTAITSAGQISGRTYASAMESSDVAKIEALRPLPQTALIQHPSSSTFLLSLAHDKTDHMLAWQPHAMT